jgi:hypothetical protein
MKKTVKGKMSDNDIYGIGEPVKIAKGSTLPDNKMVNPEVKTTKGSPYKPSESPIYKSDDGAVYMPDSHVTEPPNAWEEFNKAPDPLPDTPPIIGEVVSITDRKEGLDEVLFLVSDSKRFVLGKKYEIKP